MTRRLHIACFTIACLFAAGAAAAQNREMRPNLRPALDINPPSPFGSPDPVWEGLLIGGAIGAVEGLVLAPRWFCGNNDQECSAIVRVAIGLPSIAGGMVAGALIDKFHQRGHLVWTSRSGRRVATLDPLFRGGGAGVRLSARFR